MRVNKLVARSLCQDRASRSNSRVTDTRLRAATHLTLVALAAKISHGSQGAIAAFTESSETVMVAGAVADGPHLKKCATYL